MERGKGGWEPEVTQVVPTTGITYLSGVHGSSVPQHMDALLAEHTELHALTSPDTEVCHLWPWDYTEPKEGACVVGPWDHNIWRQRCSLPGMGS